MRGWVFALTLVLLLSGCLSGFRKEREFVCWNGSAASEPDLCPRKTTSITVTSTMNHSSSSSTTSSTTVSSATNLSASSLAFSFKGGSGTCGSEENPSISVDGNTLLFSGSVETPNPCYTLTASHTFGEKVLRIEISSHSKGGICVMCIGSVPFTGEVTGIPDGTYKMELLHNAQLILSEEIIINTTLSPTTSSLTKTSTTTLTKMSIKSPSSTSITKNSNRISAPETSAILITPAIQISSVQFDAPGDDRQNLNGEWIEISNTGDTAQNLSGWTLKDNANHTYTLPNNFTLNAGNSVKIHTGTGEDSSTDLYWGRNSAVWNNDGDTATLYNKEGEIIHSTTK